MAVTWSIQSFRKCLSCLLMATERNIDVELMNWTRCPVHAISPLLLTIVPAVMEVLGLLLDYVPELTNSKARVFEG